MGNYSYYYLEKTWWPIDEQLASTLGTIFRACGIILALTLVLMYLKSKCSFNNNKNYPLVKRSKEDEVALLQDSPLVFRHAKTYYSDEAASLLVSDQSVDPRTQVWIYRKQSRKAEALQQLRHPNTVQLIECGTRWSKQPLPEIKSKEDVEAFLQDQVPTYRKQLLNFDIIAPLGEGAFGKVFKVCYKQDNYNESHCYYALKQIKFPCDSKEQQKVLREAESLKQLRHPNIVQLIECWCEQLSPEMQNRFGSLSSSPQSIESINALSSKKPSINTWMISSYEQNESTNPLSFTMSSHEENGSTSPASSIMSSHEENGSTSPASSIISSHEENGSTSSASSTMSSYEENGSTSSASTDQNYLFIVMELCDKTLKDWLQEAQHRTRNEITNIFYQLLDAVANIHSCNFIHRDLKPSNIFLLNGCVKVGDFGLVKHSEDISLSTSTISTDYFDMYMASELKLGKTYRATCKVDIFSLGLILLEMLCCSGTAHETSIILRNARKLVLPKGFGDKYPEEAQLIHSMLQEDPDCRPTAEEIKQHAIFRKSPPPGNNDEDRSNEH